ncbi:hypothetical protein PMAYCL1PPCAC_01378, partial [Pristionchus mayeri]
KIYYNKCLIDVPWMETLLNCLIYLTYACALLVLLLYLSIFILLRFIPIFKGSRSTAELKLLKQSLVIFALYAASMLSVFILSFIDPGPQGMFNLAYAENLLNLSIAAVYPICFVAMSGEMKML